MSIFRTYRMTIASVWYDRQKEAAQEYEMHFRVARKGDIARVRRQLAQRGLTYFQRGVYSTTRHWVPKHRIKVKFEREEPAIAAERRIDIQVRKMEYRGRQWKAQPLLSRLIGYVKKRYKRRVR